jgi:hypothetical protein
MIRRGVNPQVRIEGAIDPQGEMKRLIRR